MNKKTEKERGQDGNYFFRWRIWIKLLWRITLLGSGLIIGLAGGVYWQREVCLNAVFQNNTEALTDEEINRILQTLNNTDPNQLAVQSTSSEELDSGNYLSLNDNANGQETMTTNDVVNGNNSQSEKKFVGSRNSQKFYSVDCRFAKKIKEENKVWFNSREEGEKVGKIFLECN